jgi:hypothetical protein
MTIEIIRAATTRAHLAEVAETQFGEIEFDSMINVRPSQGNSSRDVEDRELRDRIRDVVSGLMPEADR